MSVSLIPYPISCRETGGSLTLGPESRIFAPEDLSPAAAMLAHQLQRSTGHPFLVESEPVSGHGPHIEFIRDGNIANPEGYSLRASSTGVVIRASADAGAYYGGQTLLQLLPPCVYDDQPRHDIPLTLPQIEIEDAPRFRWRGVMLDSARYFQPVSYLRKFIDLLAQHKINIFHWHLTEDQGWRIEIKKYPRLTEVGSRRLESPRGHLLHPSCSGDGLPHEGFYTQDEIRALVAYAAERHVHILPEIEMPGHAQAAVAAYPELGLGAQPVPVSCRWGVHQTLFNTKPSTLQFLQDVLDEVIALFPFPYLHIGGDEALKDQWKNDPETQAHLRELGLKHEDELQCWFIGQMATFLKSRGRQLVGWDEILEGGLSEGATVMSWRGPEGAILAAKRGLESIMCDNKFLYFDYYQADDLASEPLAIGGVLPLEKVHGYDPQPAGSSGDLASSLIGIQAQLWTEYIPTVARLEYMAFPRICAFAEVGWSARERPGFPHFMQRLRPHLRRLDCQDVHYRPLRE